MQEKITIHQLVGKLVAEMKRAGFTDNTIWHCYMPRVGSIEHYYEKLGQVYYDPMVTDEYVRLQRERVKRGEIATYKPCLRAAERLNEVFMTGTIAVPQIKHGSKYVLNEENGKLLDRFLEWKQYGNNTRDDAIWAVRKYLFYFQQKGHETISDVTNEDAKEFLLQVAAEVKLSTLHTLFLYLKYFHVFMREQGIPAPDCVDLFNYTIYREMPIQSYVTDTELDAVLHVIDRETDKGKRNLAIIMIAATTGMRACDIIRMQLSDIDWRKGEIRISQKKTGRFSAFPLTREAGNALKDYILNVRPITNLPEVFLSLKPPHAAIMDTVAIGDMFSKYQKKAGIVRQPFDGKGFHGLRRRLAKKLIVNGTPLTTVAQILGHNDLQSVRQYLSLDTNNLRECALDFSDIPLTRRVEK